MWNRLISGKKDEISALTNLHKLDYFVSKQTKIMEGVIKYTEIVWQLELYKNNAFNGKKAVYIPFILNKVESIKLIE